MSQDNQLSMNSLHLVGAEELGKRWGWFLGLGILLVVLGVIALGASVTMTLATMVFIGWLMIIGGILQTVHAFTCKAWSGFFIDLLSGILYTVIGFMIVANPGSTAITLTLLIAMFLIFGGLFRIIVAIAVRYQNWVWLLLNGVVSLILGIAIWQQWPLSGLWVIGVFVGIDMLLNGWSLVMLAFAAKSLQSEEPQA
ncbi:acid-resistance membrane protein [Polystyrenella longa]|uniref:Acid-resistance membrane protein n=1 Tax=Polystyrenella longa TaxID=2528007 RepID=A0A518CJY9_9PLAN|nr:HdeD family acid-resistance protein [Polystyrenella longa]QDU79527.1 acid-resistance membrane protein [Polystyrenella longa]